jgi:alcohol dehydrogenase (NADP+)
MISAKAYSAATSGAPLKPQNIERREPGPHDVVIDIKYCGICHSDIHQVRNEWGASKFPMVPGHEIAGLVAKVGSSVKKFKVGDPVGVGCLVDSCRTCSSCSKDLEQFCTEGSVWTYNSVDKKHGGITLGGYSSVVTVDENFVLNIPKNLALDKAAPLLCAGITTYSPLKHWGAGPGKTVAILGMGGLGHMAVKIAAAMGAEVSVLSHSLKKEGDGKKFGAKNYYATSNPETFTKLRGQFDIIICTVSVGIDWNQYLSLLKVDGSMVVLGIPENAVPVQAGMLIGGRKSLSGSLIGGIKETQEMLDFCGKQNITCEIELIPAEKINEAFDRVVKSDVRYRFVVDIATL